jgi:hypothetical protein
MRRCEQAPWNNYVIADVRFPNEIKAIRDSGGRVVRVRRGPDPEWYDLARDCNLGRLQQEVMRNAYPEVHYSEWAWIGSEYDIVMDNNCSLDELKTRVDNLVDSLYNNRVEQIEDVKL